MLKCCICNTFRIFAKHTTEGLFYILTKINMPYKHENQHENQEFFQKKMALYLHFFIVSIFPQKIFLSKNSEKFSEEKADILYFLH